MTTHPYEYYAKLVRERDRICTEPGCTRRPPPKMLKAVRVDWREADSLENLRAVCRWHIPDTEAL